MAGIQDYSTTPATNDGLGLWDEGQAPSTHNDGGRQGMSDQRNLITAYTDTGAVNAYVITVPASVAPTSYVTDYEVYIDIQNANTSATVTLNINSMGVKTVTLPNGDGPLAGQITTGINQFKYDGTNFQLLTASSTPSEFFAGDTGAADAYAISVGLSSLTIGQRFNVRIANQNTGACTLDVDSIGVRNIKTQDGLDPVAGMLVVDGIYTFLWDAFNGYMMLLNPSIPLTGKTGQVSIGSSAVGQSELKSTTASQTVSVPNAGYAELSLTGGTYTMFWTAGVPVGQAPNNPANGGLHGPLHNDGTQATKLGFYNDSSGFAQTFYIYSRYIQACQPYNLGDGEVPFFAFLKINKAGEIVGTSFSEDPFWTNWGPSQVHAKYWDKVSDKGYGLTYKTIDDQLLDVPGGLYWSQARKDPSLREKYLDARRGEPERFEITHQIKTHDMHDFPHPFMFDKDLHNHTVVLVDPVSREAQDIAELHEINDKEDNPTQLFERGDLYLTNRLKRTTPKGVYAYGVRWK